MKKDMYWMLAAVLFCGLTSCSDKDEVAPKPDEPIYD